MAAAGVLQVLCRLAQSTSVEQSEAVAFVTFAATITSLTTSITCWAPLHRNAVRQVRAAALHLRDLRVRVGRTDPLLLRCCRVVSLLVEAANRTRYVAFAMLRPITPQLSEFCSPDR